MQALEEIRQPISIEQRDSALIAELDKHRPELRSLITLHERRLDSRLRELTGNSLITASSLPFSGPC